jgi:ABC-2 type transport system permease protein
MRDRTTVFWTLLFPIILATLFKLAFSNLNSAESFKAIDIAVADSVQYQNNANFKSVLEGKSKGNDRLFNLTVTSKDKAEELLKNNKISGYISVDSSIKLVVNKTGLNQNIIKSFIDNYNQSFSTMTSIIDAASARQQVKENPAKTQELIKELGNRYEYTKEVSGTSAPPDNILNYFYTLIAMACFYGSFFGNREITDIQANISSLAARINVAPVHKLKTLLYSMSASVAIFYTEMLILMAYLYYVLKIDFGSKTGLVLLTTFVGSVAGISYGAFISSIVKKGEGLKTAIYISTTMVASFLSGMMSTDIKYIIAKKVPILSYLNPLNLLTDSFYSLYYYDSLSRFSLNLGILCCFILVFCSGTYAMIRRRKYASL